MIVGSKPAVYLGQLSAATYVNLPPRMQAACREMVRLGEITIENVGGVDKNGSGTSN